MKLSILGILSITLSILLSVDFAFAAGSRLQIDIDNPKFRPLVIALPSTKDGGGWGSSSMIKSFETELQRLLRFTGLFKIMNQKAYSHLNSESLVSGGSAINTAGWKNLGVEGVVVGKSKKEGGSFTFEFQVVDLNSQKVLLSKKYEKVKDGKYLAKLFGDALLEAYTGKPGIFTTKIVFIGRKRKGENKHVFICDFDGGNVRQITKGNTLHLSPSWAPDGKSIVYTSYKSGDPDLYRHDLATNKVTRLSGYRGIDSGGQFDHNSDKVVFSGAVKGDTDIYYVPKGGGKRKLLIKGRGLDVDPTFSPNGKWLAFVSGRYGNPHVFRADISRSGNSINVVSDHRLTWAGWYNGTPAWSHDSKKIAFAGYDREIDRFDLFIIEPSGKNLERLTLRTGDNESPSWSPNSQMIVFHSNRVGTKNVKGSPQLWMMRRDGSYQRKLNVGLYDAQTPKWGPYIKK
jgi:TolB protein